MARYDRIAPLSSPARDRAFPAWPVLRDIEGQDRDIDVCRRARLRFLALRLAGEGQGGAAGFARGESHVTLTPDGGGTILEYDAKATIGGRPTPLRNARGFDRALEQFLTECPGEPVPIAAIPAGG